MSPRVLLIPFALLATASYAQKSLIQITADLTDAPRKLYHAEVDIPVHAGPLRLTTPKWIPGHHTPVGPVGDITGVVFTAGGQTIFWKRDDLDLFEYHVVIPPGVTMLHAHLDCIVTTRNVSNVAALQWEKLLLYPAGIPVSDIAIQPTLKVPAGWGIGTALTPEGPYDLNHPSESTIRYMPTTVERLQDSPVITGEYGHEYELAPEVFPKHYLDVFGVTEEEVQLRPKVIDDISNLVREAGALYKSRHYNSYHFLLTLTKNAGGGVEHSESSDNGMLEDALMNDQNLSLNGSLLPHEFAHSWNGKYRRQIGETTPDYATPMKTEMMWVYEGLTFYLGNLLAVRSDFTPEKEYREALALEAAKLDYEPGKMWRSIEDTGISVAAFRLSSIWSSSGPAWSSWRRNTDYYQEGDLLWLDVDTTIRKMTNGQKNLGDFLALFLARGGNTGPTVLPYDFKEVVTDLNKVVKNDWATFLEDRVDKVNAHVDLAGIERAGYKLVYTDKLSDYEALVLSRRGSIDVWFSLGLALDKEGMIQDVRLGGPSDKALLSPGEKIIAVNGVIYSEAEVRNALRHGKASGTPMVLIVQNDRLVRTISVDYHDGERYPTLVRMDGTTDYLSEILKPLTKP